MHKLVLIIGCVFTDSLEKEQFVWSVFTIENDTLSTAKAMKSSFNEKMILGGIQIWGITSNISRVSLNNHEIQFKYDNKEHVSFLFL